LSINAFNYVVDVIVYTLYLVYFVGDYLICREQMISVVDYKFVNKNASLTAVLC